MCAGKREPSSSPNAATSMACCKPLAAPLQLLHHRDRSQHAERAVVAARIDDGVEVGAEHDRRRAGRLALVAAEQAEQRIGAHAHAGPSHPGLDLPDRLDMRGTQIAPRELARNLA